MKKYLITGALALFVGGFLTSCHDNDGVYSSIVEQKTQEYQKLFVQEFGEIDPQQDWGFGTSSIAARTRAFEARTRGLADNLPTPPVFRDTNPISKPTEPNYYNTKAQVTADKSIYYAGSKNNYNHGDIFYIDADCSMVNPQNYKDLTIYVVGNSNSPVTYSGQTHQGGENEGDGSGTTFCVTTGAKLILGAISKNLKVYLAPGSTLDVSSARLQFAGEHSAVYMSRGSNVIGGDLSFFDGCQVFISEGAKITATNLEVKKNSTLWNEGTVKVTKELFIEYENGYVYNKADKTISAETIKVGNNNDLLYNDGIITCTDSISFQNSEAEIVNNGTLSAASISHRAGGKMHNVGVATISGLTYITNDENTQWQNDGQYTSGSFTVYDANRVYNNCKLTVTNTTGDGVFTLAESQFVLNGGEDYGASLICDSFVWETNAGGQFHMGNKSLLKVNGTMLMKNNNYGYGFHGYGTDYAVIQAQAIEKDVEDQYKAWYDGKLFIDAGSHFDQGYKNNNGADQPYYYYDPETVVFHIGDTDTDVSVSIPYSICNPGYNYTGKTDEISIISNSDETTTSGWHQEGYIVKCGESGRVFCEDLGVVRASDIDFNDLVFDAYIFKKTPVTRYWKKDSNGNKEYWKDERSGSDEYYAEVYLLAAGGTLDLTISGKLKDGTTVGATSVKPYMGVGKTTILNTIMPNGETYGNIPDNKDQAPEKLVFEGVSSIANISIIVFYKSESQMTALELEAYQGAAPHKLCVPITTQWPIERAEINLAYEDFTKYVKGVDSEGKKIIVTTNGTTNDGESYYEKVNDLWNTKNPDYIYTSTVSYPVPDLSERFEASGKIEEDDATSASGGYNGTGPILIRTRH